MRLTFTKIVCIFLLLPSVTIGAQEYPSLNLGGSVFLDYDSFDGNFLETEDESEDNFELRRLRFSIASDFNAYWSAKFKFDADDSPEIKDAYIQYNGLDFANITVGKQKEPFGLERLMSSRNLSFIERSMMSNAISPARSLGINFSGNKGAVNWQLGYFHDDNSEKGNAVTGRLTWAPWQAGKNLVHLGAAFSERSLHGDVFRINEKMEVNTADSLIEGSKINADSISQTGMEFVWQFNGLVNMAEWQQSKVTATNGSDYQYTGGYYQLSYLFSGKNRKYKNGILGNIKTKNDWEVTMRYSQLRLHEENSEAKVMSVGLNYLLDNDLKFMANYLNADYVDEGVDLRSGNAISLRMLYRF
jgi:phosphate-selective porin OprO/OprP